MKPITAQTTYPPQVAAESTDNLALLVFNLNGQLYGLPITRVVRIIEMVAITPLPGAPEAIQGIINLRGKTTPVIDLRRRFGLPARAYGLHTPIILVDTNGQGQSLGVVADAVDDVLNVSLEEIELNSTIMPEAMNEQMGNWTSYLTGVAKVDRRLILVLEVAALLNQSDQRQLSLALGQGAFR